MKIKTLSLLLIVFPIFLNAQNTPITWGKEFKIPSQDGQPLFIGITNHHYFLNYKDKKENKLLVYDFDHNRVATIPLGKNQDGKRIIAESIIKLRAGYFLITSAYYRKEKIEFVYISHIEESGNVELSTDRLFAYSTKKNRSIINLHYGVNPHNQDKYGFAISPDSTKLLFSRVTGIEQALRTAGNDKYQLFVFDQFFEKIWEKTIFLPSIDKNINVDQFAVTNNGNAFLFTSRRQTIGRMKNRIPSYNLSIFRVNEDGVFAQIDLLIPDSYPIVATGFCDESESLHIAGFYTNGHRPVKEWGANGTFMMKFDDKDKLLFSKKIPFDEKLKKALAPSIMKNGGYSFFKYEIDLLLVDYQSKRFLFVGENRYRSNDRGQHSNDILIPSFSFDGELNWIHHYPKKYSIRGSKSISNSNIFLWDDKIFLLHHCYKSKKERKKLHHKKRFLPFSYYTDLVGINFDGNLTSKETLFFSRDFKKLLYTTLCRDINNGKFLVFTKGEINGVNKFQFGTFEVNN